MKDTEKNPSLGYSLAIPVKLASGSDPHLL